MEVGHYFFLSVLVYLIISIEAFRFLQDIPLVALVPHIRSLVRHLSLHVVGKVHLQEPVTLYTRLSEEDTFAAEIRAAITTFAIIIVTFLFLVIHFFCFDVAKVGQADEALG